MADLFREPFGDTSAWTEEDHAAANAEREQDMAAAFDALSEDFVAGHDAGYLSGVIDSAATSADTARLWHTAGVRAGRRQYGRDVLALAFAAFAAFLAGELLGAALTPFVSPRGGVR